MSKGALVGGWCPKHDKVYDTADDRCPDCGTTLVPMGDRPGEPEPNEELLTAEPIPATALSPGPPARSPWIPRALVAAGLAGAFLLGVLFPRTEPDLAPRSSGKVARVQVRPGRLITAIGGQLRLVELVQLGDRITAEFETFEGFADPKFIEGAALEVTTDGGSSGESTFGISDTQLVPSATGFQVRGRLEVTDEPVVEIRITSIQIGGDQFPSWTVNISSIWPVTGPEPKLLRVSGQTRQAGEGSIRLVSVLGWSNRLEAVFELRGLGSPSDLRYRLTGIQLAVDRTDAPGTRVGQAPQTFAATNEEQISAGQLIARFEGLPLDAKRVTIRATQLLRFVNGPWSWRI